MYNKETKRTTYSAVPTSDTTAEAVAVDGFATRQKDNTGIMTTAARHYSADGTTLTQTNGRGNATATETDKAGFTSRKGATVNDTFAYNSRSELTEATVSGAPYSYACDSMGHRATKKVTNNGEITLHQRYVYRDYLQIACCDLTRANHPCLWLITWDPTQPIATRPLAIQKSGTWYCYGWDLTKNICEVFGSNGYINTIYTYTPYGEVTSSGSTAQPIQWSSEFNDSELGLVYYNYRHYNSVDGRWLGKDLSLNAESSNLYLYAINTPIHMHDVWGNFSATATMTTAGMVISAPVLVGALVAVAIVVAVVYVATKKCLPCPPPIQQPGSRLDCIPPSCPHYPCKGNHLHSWVFVMYQNPKTWQCHEKKEETVTCL